MEEKSKQDLKATFGIVLKEEMAVRKLSYKNVSEITGIPKSTLHDWAEGVIPSRSDWVLKLAEFFRKEGESVQEAFYRMNFGEWIEEEKMKASEVSEIRPNPLADA